MSSPGPSFASSPGILSFQASQHAQARKSQFTYKHLSQLKSYTPTTPLRCIAHVDLDAFYAQCEMVRLDTDRSKPLAVQQWQGLIAINYPARAHGLNRHITPTEALKLCPELILQHVATWREGEDTWAYREDAANHIATDKVSLDPYRRESRKILATIKESLPAKEQRVEKASVDEVFMDLSAQVHGVLLERYPELRGPPPYDDPSEHLPRPPSTVLDWSADEVVGTGKEDGELQEPDWDDVCLGIAAEIVRHVRKQIWEKLSYTCSGGIARNKMLAKLGSGYKKPNQQTVIRNRAVEHFLGEMKFTKIRMLGGKLGDEAVAMFGTDLVKDLLTQPMEQLKKLGDDTGAWLYETIRGEDTSEVNPRVQIKSMLSAKSFRPAINSFEQGVRWLRIFVADIFSRCVEEGVLENKRRPKTIVFHHRQGAQTKSRSCQIPQGKPLSETMLFDLAKNLLAQVVVGGRAWPCANLSLSVGGWEDGVANNRGIGDFLVKGIGPSMITPAGITGEPPRKRQKKGNIANFFGPRDEKKKDFDAARAVLKAHYESTREEEEEHDEGEREDDFHDSNENAPIHDPEAVFEDRGDKLLPHEDSVEEDIEVNRPPSAQPQFEVVQSSKPRRNENEAYFCPRCNGYMPLDEKAEHDDFHFAMDLSKEMRQEERRPSTEHKTPVGKKSTRGRGRPPGKGSTPGKDQAKLMFGRRG